MESLFWHMEERCGNLTGESTFYIEKLLTTDGSTRTHNAPVEASGGVCSKRSALPSIGTRVESSMLRRLCGNLAPRDSLACSLAINYSD